MELSQLACFVAVSEERSFTRGAKRLDVVQSAASASVARLEHELGVSLLTRTTRSVTPTDAGVAVYRRALQVLVAVQDVRDEVQAFRDGERGTVVVGVVLSTGTIDLAGVLAELQQSQPGIVVQLRFNPGTAETRHEPLLDGTVDLAVVPVLSPTPPEVMVRPIARTSMSLVCRRDDPLARARSVPLSDIRHRPFIDFPEGWGNRAIVDALFARGHVTRDVRVEVADVSTASMLIQQSLGIGFLPSDLPLATWLWWTSPTRSRPSCWAWRAPLDGRCRRLPASWPARSSRTPSTPSSCPEPPTTQSDPRCLQGDCHNLEERGTFPSRRIQRSVVFHGFQRRQRS